MRSVARLASLAAAAGIVVAVALPVEAAPDRKACIAAADDGQKYRDDGKLAAAREMFIACSSKGCPAVISKQCAQWLSEVEKDQATVTFRAKDESGKEITDVTVSIDAHKVLDAIDAKAMPIDPGEHTVRFERADGKFVEEKVIIRAGEKNRVLELAFPTATAQKKDDPIKPDDTSDPLPEKQGFHVPLLGWVGLGVGVAGGITMAAFAVSAGSDESELRDRGCAPNCPPSERDGIETKLVIANVGMFVGIAGLAVAVVSTVIANTGNKAPAQQGASKASFAIRPSPFGLSGTF